LRLLSCSALFSSYAASLDTEVHQARAMNCAIWRSSGKPLRATPEAALAQDSDFAQEVDRAMLR